MWERQTKLELEKGMRQLTAWIQGEALSVCVCVCVVLCFHIYLETTKNQQQVTTKQQYLHISIQENFYFFYKKKHAQVFLRLDHFRWNQTLWLKKQDFKDKLGFGFELDSC